MASTAPTNTKLDRLERVTDLVLVLLETQQPLTLDAIAHQVPGYPAEHAARRQAWLQEDWPRILRAAKRRKGLILFAEEASCAQWGS